MKFDKSQHQKVRYDGQLYVVLFEEYPDYMRLPAEAPIVLHPIGNDWIVKITNPTVRKFLTVAKGTATEVPAHTNE